MVLIAGHAFIVFGRRHTKEEEELRKLKSSGMGTVILKDLQEKKRYEHWKQENLDPRNASRTPSASKEPMYRMRYESPVGASPSRNLDHQKPFYEDEFDRSTSYRGSVGRAIGNATSYNGKQNGRGTGEMYMGGRTKYIMCSTRWVRMLVKFV